MLDHHLGKLSYLVSRFLSKPFFKFNTMFVLNTASASLRYNYVTPSAATAIATGFLKDLINAGYLSKEQNFLACDLSKLQRARHKVLKNAKNSDYDNIKSSDPISAIYFDGRRDFTLSMISDQDGILHRRIVKE